MAMCNIGHTFYRKKAASMAMVSYAKTDDATKTNLKVVYPRCSVCFMTKKAARMVRRVSCLDY